MLNMKHPACTLRVWMKLMVGSAKIAPMRVSALSPPPISMAS
jgi:hypothetical protein